MGKWKQMIVEGNQLFKQRSFAEAFDAYQAAKERAHVLYDIWPDANEAISALVVSYHNLAELHSKNGHKHLEYSELQQVHDFLSAELDRCDDETRSFAIFNGISKAETQLVQFLSQHKRHQMNTTRTTLRLN